MERRVNRTILVVAALLACGIVFATAAAVRRARYTSERTIDVCNTPGTVCQFTTIQGAINSITSTSATSRYTVVVHSGDWFETVSINKSYITLRGIDRKNTRIGDGNGAACGGTGETLCVQPDLVDVGLENITIGGNLSIRLKANVSGVSHTYMSNVTLGVNDTDAGFNVTGDCLITVDAGAGDTTKGHHVVMNDIVCNSEQDGLLWSAGDQWEIAGYQFYGTSTANFNNSRVFRNGGSECGARIIAGNVVAYEATGGTQTTGGLLVVTGQSVACSGGTGVYIVLNGATYVRRATNTLGSNARCIYLGTNGADSNPSRIILNSVFCDIASTSGTGTISAVEFDNDADHSNWTVDYNSGAIRIAGGATRRAFDLGDTSGLVLNVGNVLSDGSSTGSGIVNYYNTPLTTGVIRNTPLATAPATCSIGDRYTDTSGADCFCKAANTWEITNATGACV